MTPAERIEYFNTQTERGFEVLEPGPRDLLLDLDWMGHPVSQQTHGRQLRELRKRVARLDRYISDRHCSEIVMVELKRSPFHYHGRVTLSFTPTFLERQVFELLLGSDPCRAQHNLNHQGGPYSEMLTTIPGPWMELKWIADDGK